MVAACVRLPRCACSVSRIRSRSTSSMRRPTSPAMPPAPAAGGGSGCRLGAPAARSRRPRSCRRWPAAPRDGSCSPARAHCRARACASARAMRLRRDRAERQRRSPRRSGARNARPAPRCRRGRSRSGGMRSETTLRRKYRSSRNFPRATSAARSRLVVARMRTLTFTGCAPPTRSISRSCTARSSLACSRSVHLADLVEQQRAADRPPRTCRCGGRARR